MVSKLGTEELTSDEERHLRKEILNQLKLLLLTDEVRAERMSVEDEVENGLYFFTHTIWDSIPRLYKDIRLALKPIIQKLMLSIVTLCPLYYDIVLGLGVIEMEIQMLPLRLLGKHL